VIALETGQADGLEMAYADVDGISVTFASPLDADCWVAIVCDAEPHDFDPAAVAADIGEEADRFECLVAALGLPWDALTVRTVRQQIAVMLGDGDALREVYSSSPQELARLRLLAGPGLGSVAAMLRCVRVYRERALCTLGEMP
jgi:hypothetical protein